MEIIFAGDPHRMNWIRPDHPYAQVRLPARLDGSGEADELVATAHTERVGDEVRTSITIRNVSSRPYFTKLDDIGITLPLEDRYDDPDVLATRRCNAHVFCGGSASYVLALRMGGDAPHFGLVLTEGDLAAYSVERDDQLESNDRGCFILHPAPLVLEPGESTRIAWTIFPCEGKADFLAQAARRTRFVHADWSRYVLFPGEHSELQIETSFDTDNVTVTGAAVEQTGARTYRARFEATTPGEHELIVAADDRTVRTRLLVKDDFYAVLERRCAFIAQHQQYRGPVTTLHGAFLAYDNEEEHVYYNQANDYNGGRERVGMGILLAMYLHGVRDGVVPVRDPLVPLLVRESLDLHTEFVHRELVDAETGEAFNDTGRDGSFKRLYNAPWYASYFLALYRLDGRTDDARTAFRIIEHYYAEGGSEFYPLELPIAALCEALQDAGLPEELAAATGSFVAHARQLARVGQAYPESEVNYEQSIVAPAADVILQGYRLSGDPELLAAAQQQIRVLEQFHGIQPDYHLHEVAVRHWDGHWFGKRRLYGDTFPHYWSALTGNVFAVYAETVGDPEYAARAGESLRAVLPLIFDDGRASCAYVFPLTVNGQRAAYYDPYANDQDWALVFSLRTLHKTSGAVIA